MDNKISFINENETAEDFFVLMDTMVNETTYILVSDADPEEEDDCECFILKMTGEEGGEAVYESVDDDEEFSSISKIFEELLEVEFAE